MKKDAQEGEAELLARLRVAERALGMLESGELPTLDRFIFQARFTLRAAKSAQDLESVSSSNSLDEVHSRSLPGACIALSSKGGVRACVTYSPDASEKELAFYAQALRSVLVPTYAAVGLDMRAAQERTD